MKFRLELFIFFIIFILSCKPTYPLETINYNYADNNSPTYTLVSVYQSPRIESRFDDSCTLRGLLPLSLMTIMTKADARYFNIKIDSNYFENKRIPFGHKVGKFVMDKIFFEPEPIFKYKPNLLVKCSEKQYVIIQYKHRIEAITDIVEEHIDNYKEILQSGNYNPKIYISNLDGKHNCNIYHIVSKIDYCMKFSIDGREVKGTITSSGEIWTPYKFKVCNNFDSLVRTFPREQYELMFKNSITYSKP